MTTAPITPAALAGTHLPIPHPHLHIGHAEKMLEHSLAQVHVPALAVVFALSGALCYAVSSILQQRAAAEQPPEMSLRFGLLVRLVRSPRWMIGNLCDIGGFVFQFLALRQGALALVSPLFVAGLAFSIIGNALVQRRWPTRMEWLGSVATVVGLGVFVGVAQPGPGFPHASSFAWSMLFLATTVICGVAILLARGSARRRAFMLAVATGVLYGVTAAVTEHTGHQLSGGFVNLLTNWSPYMLAVVGIAGLLVNQSAYQAGDLRMSLPVLTVLEPIVAIVIGQLLFDEHIAGGAGARVGEVLGLVTMVVGVVWLARSVPDEAPSGLPPGDGGDAAGTSARPPAGAPVRPPTGTSARSATGASPRSATCTEVGASGTGSTGRPARDPLAGARFPGHRNPGARFPDARFPGHRNPGARFQR